MSNKDVSESEKSDKDDKSDKQKLINRPYVSRMVTISNLLG